MPLDEIADRYQIHDKLGAGGFGSVFKASQLSTGQSVAIKMLHVDSRGSADDAARFQRELKIVAGLNHPHIVRLLDSGEVSDGRYIVFEYVDGESLAERLTRGPMPLREAARLMGQVLDALGCAHAAGVVHRDVKPQNIMLTGTGLRANAQLLDFGIAAVAEEQRDADYDVLTRDGEAPGTLCYSAPEQLRGQMGPQADIFSWGLVFIECLTARRVLAGRLQSDVLRRLLGPEPIPLPMELVEHPIGEVLLRAVKKDPTTRFPSAQAALQALEDCPFNGLEPPDRAVLAPTAALPTTPDPPDSTSRHMSGESSPTTPEPEPRSRTALWPGLLAAAVIGGGLFFFATQDEPAPPAAPQKAAITQAAPESPLVRHTQAVMQAVGNADFAAAESGVRAAWADHRLDRPAFDSWLRQEASLAALRAHPTWGALFPPVVDAAVPVPDAEVEAPKAVKKVRPKAVTQPKRVAKPAPVERIIVTPPPKPEPPDNEDWKRFH